MTLPNQLTILRMLLSPVVVLILVSNIPYHYQIAFTVFFIASLTDFYDGWFARKYGYVSKWGAFLDPLADKILIISTLVAFVMLKYIKLWVVMVIVARDIIVTILRIYGSVRKKPVVTSNLAKWKTFAQVGLVYFIFIFVNLEKAYGVEVADYRLLGSITLQGFFNKAVLFVTLFTAVTGLHYMLDNRRHVKDIFWRFYKAFIPS